MRLVKYPTCPCTWELGSMLWRWKEQFCSEPTRSVKKSRFYEMTLKILGIITTARYNCSTCIWRRSKFIPGNHRSASSCAQSTHFAPNFSGFSKIATEWYVFQQILTFWEESSQSYLTMLTGANPPPPLIPSRSFLQWYFPISFSSFFCIFFYFDITSHLHISPWASFVCIRAEEKTFSSFHATFYQELGLGETTATIAIQVRLK